MKKMHNIKELVKKLCPNGVEYKELNTLVDYIQPTKYIVKSTKYNDEYDIPVLTPGQTFILGYTNEADGIYKASKEKPAILFDDFTTAFRWIDFEFKVKSSAVKILVLKSNENNFKYIYYAMQCISYIPSQQARHCISTYSKILIPVQPIEVQNEIVRILDNFTELEAELKAELEARKKQYEYYRDKLLKETNGNKTELHEFLKIKNGCDYKKLNVGKYPVYGTGGIMTYVDEYVYDKPSVLIPRKGSLDKLYYVEVPFWNVDTIFYTEIDEKKANPKYIYYCLENEHLEQYNHAGGIPSLTQKVLNRVKIPLPELEEQQKIVSILDRFDKLCNDISQGLPAEIEARRKQYEYYRDKLLNFKELKVENKE